MRRSGRSNVVTWLTSNAFGVRSLAAAKPAAFLFCAVRLAILFARLSDRLGAKNAQIRILWRRGWLDVVFELIIQKRWRFVSESRRAGQRQRCGIQLLSLGQPRKLSGLKARFTFGASAEAWVSSRFQRWVNAAIKFLGRCPRPKVTTRLWRAVLKKQPSYLLPSSWVNDLN